MRESDFFEWGFRSEEIPRYAAVVSSPSSNFGALVGIAGLDPAIAFVETGLRGVDFSDSDLRGFNFKGADLRGAIGFRVKIDSTTNFDGASVVNSIFAFRAGQGRFFEENPQWERLLRSLRNYDAIGLELWLGSNLSNEQNREAVSRVALALFGSTSSSHTKATILYYARFQFNDIHAYRDFLADQLASSDESPVLAACCNIIGRLFSCDEFLLSMCRELLRHPSEMVRRSALTAIMNGLSGSNALPIFLTEYIATEASGEIRRDYLRRLAPRLSRVHDELARDTVRRHQYRDFAVPVTAKEMDAVADLVSSTDLAAAALTEAERKVAELARQQRSTRRDIVAELKRRRARQIFREFRDIGINFTFVEHEASLPLFVKV